MERVERTTVIRLESWEEFEAKVKTFEDPTRKVWDEVWFRGQGEARWSLHTTLERRSKQIRAVASYLHRISEIKPAVETFIGAEFSLPNGFEIDEACREYEPFEPWIRGLITYMAHLRHGAFPSPLLDWTSSPYVAAYFAFSNARHDGEVAIYAYRERPVNFKVDGSDTPKIISFGPIVKTHKRHFRQQSRYTVCARFQDGQWLFVPHESVFEITNHLQQDLLWKMTVPASERQKAIQYFDKFNLNEFTLFDSEEGLLEMLATRVIDMREPF